MTITKVRFFTIADYQEEEQFLMKMHREGYRFVKMILPCFFVFEPCTPENVVYRLDYKNNQERADYMQMISDFGWEYLGKKLGWLYFRKPKGENDDLFSDDASKLDMVNKLFKTRMLPLSLIFLFTVIPNCILYIIEGPDSFALFGFFMVMLYIYLIIYCGRKIRHMKRDLEHYENAGK